MTPVPPPDCGMDQCGEAALRRFWADLVPPFSDPAQLLNMSDPDERAVTMLLKTLYVVCKGKLEGRQRFWSLRAFAPRQSFRDVDLDD